MKCLHFSTVENVAPGQLLSMSGGLPRVPEAWWPVKCWQLCPVVDTVEWGFLKGSGNRSPFHTGLVNSCCANCVLLGTDCFTYACRFLFLQRCFSCVGVGKH